MNEAGKRLLLVMVLGMLMISILPANALANSAEPPSLVILINNPPDDLSIVLVSNESQPEAIVRRVAWEGYYVFYSRDIQVGGKYTFKVTTNGESFECTLGAPLQRYNNVVTLNVSNQELTPGKYPFRSVLLVSIRLLLTLILEGIIFWLFRFRQTRSWLIFLAINLVTQGILNVLLNSGGSLMPSYLIFSLLVGEIFVFAAEMIAFPIYIKEHKKSRILIYAFIANLISLIAGGYIISVLPV
ncbi:hypothetical protein E4K67_20310 [Desulfosporosinus fructosivorans]|uniref:Uncharacterized protein n=1 Tax=Desulfosporosinus fructosivorans TaxID=2018669 RepID=A0A4Z0R1N0_9FIRM|nr:hypothetical protein [Desulfosporosinus fructosivorans]TGE36285.1 hypothetical protein E4K67_20310 [Desulfosporosinus fructosivorans]